MSDYKIGSIVPLSDDNKGARMAVALKEMAALTSERDALRAELARLQRNEDCVQRLIVWAAENGWNGVDNAKILDSFIIGLFDELRAELAAAKERGDGLYLGLRQTLEALGGVAQPGVSEAFLILGVPGEAAAIKRVNTALAADNERLRVGLRGVLDRIQSGQLEGACSQIGLLLVATPAQSLAAHDAAVKVAVLREVVEELRDMARDREDSSYDIAAYTVEQKADRIEKEAQRG